MNLKACNSFRLFNGKAAEADLAELSEHGHQENDLVSHNRVVFRGGEGALQALPPLQGFIPEARLNLIIHYLRAGDVKEAYALVTDMEPQSPPVRPGRPACPALTCPVLSCLPAAGFSPRPPRPRRCAPPCSDGPRDPPCWADAAPRTRRRSSS